MDGKDWTSGWDGHYIMYVLGGVRHQEQQGKKMPIIRREGKRWDTTVRPLIMGKG